MQSSRGMCVHQRHLQHYGCGSSCWNSPIGVPADGASNDDPCVLAGRSDVHRRELRPRRRRMPLHHQAPVHDSQLHQRPM
jgi:hypothetical protein